MATDAVAESEGCKKVREFYFVKFFRYEDADDRVKIEQAEKLIEKLYQERTPIREENYKILDARSQLNLLRSHSSRTPHDVYAVNWKQQKLNNLKEALHKLDFAKSAHKRGTSTSSSSSGESNFHHTLRLRMLHESSNLATERKMLKEINPSRSQQDDISSFNNSVKELNERLGLFLGQYQDKNITRYKHIVKGIKDFEEKMEKAKANACQNGRIWDPWTSRNTIQDQINLINMILEEKRKDDRELIVEIKRKEKKLNKVAGKDESLLEKQLFDINYNMYEAQNCIHKLRKRHELQKASYHYYLSLMNKVRELAKMKDVAVLKKLSRGQVDKFMSRWNNSKLFRSSYEERILSSLDERQLSKDGRMRNPDEGSVN
ncbi:hypothetical protein REPUB_Repub15cG0138200 [Reevesia pubescens]